VVIPAKRPVAEFSKLLFERLRLQIAIGVRAVNSNALSLDDCTMTLSGGSSRDYAGISLFAQGYCVGLSVCNCRFETTFVPTATPGVVQEMPLARPGATPPLPVVASASFADTRVIAREGLRMAVGCLVCPHIDNFPDPNADGVERVSFPTLLDGGSFTGNVFSEMTFAIMATAKTGLVRIHGNTVVDCIGGFWLKSNEAVGAEQPPELHFAIGERVPPEGDTLWINLAISLQEALVLTALGLAYQLPDGVTTGVSGIAVSASMLIGDNKVGALPLNPERAPTAFPALAVITGPSDAGVDTGGSMTISANRFQARPNLDYPCVLLAYFGRCAVTGNLISAEPFGSPPHNVSLTVIPQGFRKRGSEDQFLAPNLAVSGNVMEGGTDLDLLLRPDVTTPPLTAPFNTWLPFNSVA
jgi:hypothetical protein